MVIDMILDRKDWSEDGYTYYDPADFYSAMLDYTNMGGEEISRAMDEGTEEDVKKALCNYIRNNGYNQRICDYISSVDWLEPVDGKKPPYYGVTEFENPPKIVKITYGENKSNGSMQKKKESLNKASESKQTFYRLQWYDQNAETELDHEDFYEDTLNEVYKVAYIYQESLKSGVVLEIYEMAIDDNDKIEWVDTIDNLYSPLDERKQVTESSRSNGAKFFDAFVYGKAKELLSDYDVNHAQGGDAWYGIGDGVEDMERDHRDGFISYNDGGVEKTWSTTSWQIAMQGCADARIEKDYDYLQEQCESDYTDYCEREGIECDLQSDEFYDYESEWWNESCAIYATAEVMLYSRDSSDGKYSLLGRISRNFDYTYGRQKYNEDDLEVRMDLTPEQLTSENAEAFLAEFEKQLETYSFSNGKQAITLDAK